MMTLAGNELARKIGKSDEVDQLRRFGHPHGRLEGDTGGFHQDKHWLGLLSIVIVETGSDCVAQAVLKT